MSINFPNPWAPHTTTFFYTLPESERSKVFQKNTTQSFYKSEGKELDKNIDKCKNEITFDQWVQLTNEFNSESKVQNNKLTKQPHKKTLKKIESYSIFPKLDIEESNNSQDILIVDVSEKITSYSETSNIANTSIQEKEENDETDLKKIEIYRNQRMERRRRGFYDFKEQNNNTYDN